MSDPRADVALLVDFTDLRQSLCPDADEEAAAPPPFHDPALDDDDAAPVEPEASPGEEHPDPHELATSLRRFASSIGRVAIARAYADWSSCTELAGVLCRAQLEPVLVPGTPDGCDRSHVRLVVEALRALYTGDEPDAFVLVTGDPTLLPLVQELKADGSEVVVIAPSRTVSEELREAADRYYALEDVLEGATPEPARPRTWRSRTGAGGAEPDGRARTPAADARPERAPHPTPIRCEQDFESYDWVPFIKLIDELEHRLPFVGVRYLVNKVLGPHNCGIDDPRLKRDLINRAVDVEMIEMYPVGNVGDRADPVTACRLNRACSDVVAVLGSTTTPVPPPEHNHHNGEDE